MRFILLINLALAVLFLMSCDNEVERVESWVDLSEWQEVIYNYPANGQGSAVWELSNDNQWATQKHNGNPTILVSDIDITGVAVEGSWLMKDKGDDDFVGFVFGYQDPGHFYLMDWKKATQDVHEIGLAKQGISIKRITADYSGPETGDLEASQPFDGTDLWNTEGTEGKVALLYHEKTEGWAFEKEYGFILKFDPGSFTVTIKDGERTIFSKTLNDTTYENGKFGFYNFSQAPVIYKGFKTISFVSEENIPWWIILLVLVLFITAYVLYRRRKAAD